MPDSGVVEITRRADGWALNVEGVLYLHEQAALRWARRHSRRRVATALLVLVALAAIAWGLWTWQEVNRLRSVLVSEQRLRDCYRYQAVKVPRPPAMDLDRLARECAERQ